MTNQVNETCTPKLDVNVSDIFRTAHVKRWHSVKMIRDQSNAEHMYIATWIGIFLAKRIWPDMPMKEELTLIRWLMVHDVPESTTGDIATPVKRYLEKQMPEIKHHLEVIEERACPEYGYWKAEVTDTPLRRIAKLADMIEMLFFSYNESVDDYSEEREKRIFKGINSMAQDSSKKYPDLNWSEALDFIEDVKTSKSTHLDFEWGNKDI